MQQKTNEKIKSGLYIHWPFCIKKCPYCDFNSYAFEHEPQTWVNALLLEMEQSQKQFPNYQMATIFFGGGTPSLIPPKYIEQLILKAHQLWGKSDEEKQHEIGHIKNEKTLLTETNLTNETQPFCAKNFENKIEITLETNPSSVETHSLEEFMAAGINRFSIGMQSLNDYNLQFLGRTHSAQEAIKILTHASQICSNVSADFIYTLPSDTPLTWKNDLNTILELANKLNLKHLSLYQLTIESNTAFEQQVAAKLWEPMDEDRQSILYKHTHQTLLKHGWDFYEISNAARINERGMINKSQHNLLYWNYQPYLGIGPGAHSRMLNEHNKRIKFYNIKSPYKWLETIHDREKTYLAQKLDLEELTEKDQFQEKMLMGLRLTQGIKITKDDMQFINPGSFEKLLKHNFISFDGQNIKTTLRGRLCLNAILKEMLER